MTKTSEKLLANGLTLVVRKNYYDGLWEIHYTDGGKWAGPYKTKKEAVEKLEEAE